MEIFIAKYFYLEKSIENILLEDAIFMKDNIRRGIVYCTLWALLYLVNLSYDYV